MVTQPAPLVTGYLYPWDVLGDPDAASWVRATGVDRVALAAAYHSVRAGTPRHPARRVVDAREAALYLPVTGAWDGSVLRPGDAAEWTGIENSFAEAAAVLRGAGILVDAWTVLTHSSAAGSTRPDLCVHNAFGEVYRYALCPAQPQVRQYAATLVAQVLALGNPDGLVLEAVGPLGFGHQNQHEKTEGAEYSPWVQALLSLCFCDACSTTYNERGLSAEALRARVRDVIQRDIDPDATPETAPEAAEFHPLLEARWDATAALLNACLDPVPASGIHISVHTSPDPWSTGPFVSVEALRRSRLWSLMDKVTAVVPCWGEPMRGASTVAKMRAAVPAGRVGSYVLVLPPKATDPDAIAQEWRVLLGAGSSELHVYHLGLASTTRLNAASHAVKNVTTHR